jgi:hypothetical protein
MNKEKIKYLLYSSLIGLIVYAVIGELIAWLIVLFGNNHPHSMIEIILVLFPLFGSPAGLIVGLITAMILKAATYKKILMLTTITALIFYLALSNL